MSFICLIAPTVVRNETVKTSKESILHKINKNNVSLTIFLLFNIREKQYRHLNKVEYFILFLSKILCQ